jgi:hypothetical protein
LGPSRRGSGPAKAAQPQTGRAFPAARPEGESTKPKTGVPPWEITDSFLAVPPADAGGPSRPGAAPTSPPAPPAVPSQSAGPASADSTESFPAVDPGTGRRSFPGADSGDSTESFPAVRPLAEMEEAFRLFPPVRGTDNQPPADRLD